MENDTSSKGDTYQYSHRKTYTVKRVSLPNDAVRSVQRDSLVNEGELDIALVVTLDVSQVTNMAFVIVWSTVVLVERVEVRSRRGTPAREISRHAVTGRHYMSPSQP